MVVEKETKFTNIFTFGYTINIVIIRRGVITGKGGKENFFTK